MTTTLKSNKIAYIEEDNLVSYPLSIFLLSFIIKYIKKGECIMETFGKILESVDSFVWGPVMLILPVGTGIFLTIRTGFLPWRNLPYAIKSTLSKEAR